ncbi:MAG: phage virion morphogenesis protein [Desulfobaccales bacterium]
MLRAWIVGDDAVLARLDAIPGSVAAALRQAVLGQAFALVRYVQGQKLSGQVLKNRSSHLRDSIHAEMQESGAQIGATVGTNVKYAAIHEYGFDGIEAVKAHQRRITQAFGHALKFPVWASVRPFDRHMKMPERSFLRSSLAENAGSIRAAIEAAVAQGVKG